MDPITKNILVEWMQISMIALVLGLAVTSMIRQFRPELSWNTRGNVWTGPIHSGDFVIVCGLMVLFYLTITGTKAVTADTGSGDSMSSSTVLFGSVVLLFIGGLTAGVIAIRGTNMVEFYGLNRSHPAKIIGFAILGCVAAYVIGVPLLAWWTETVVTPLIGEPKEQALVSFLKDTASSTDRLAVIISACIVAPLAEEFIFRGYLYPVIKRFTEPIFAALITSLVFALIHHNLAALPVLFVLSLVLIFSYERSGTIWLPITIHALFNSVNIVNMLVDQ